MRGFEVTEGRDAQVGAFAVRRVLPRRARRTVGAWCFADHMGPGSVSEEQGLDIGPHPHIGLQTVTWLLEGEVLHRDSLGSEQIIRPGQLNLMTAGAGVSHSEETRGTYDGPLHGVQLWVALPEATRHGLPAFEHHPELPRVELEHAEATILVGRLGDLESPARRDTDHLGIDVQVRPGTSVLPLSPGHEHAITVIEGEASVGATGVDATRLPPGRLAYLPPGSEALHLEADASARVLVLGGVPFPDPVVMWWNYVARNRGEVSDAHRDWLAASDRFGVVDSPLDRVLVDPPDWDR